MRGPPASSSQGSMLVGASSSHKPVLLCVCVYWGVRGILLCVLFPFFLLLLFGLWLAPGLGVWRGSDASREGTEEPGGGHGVCGRICKEKFGVL